MNCRCKCGNTKIISKSSLENGRTTSCRECTFIKKYDDIKGKQFGSYEVVSNPYKKKYGKNKHIFVDCKCLLCGHIKDIPVSSLLRGEREMCQKCAAMKNLEKANIQNELHRYDNNIYEEKDDHIVLHIKNKDVLIDKEDYELVKNYVWRIIGNYVFTGHLKDVDFISMHHLILKNKYGDDIEFNSQIQTDHINRNGLDNRKHNLRIVTVDDNLKNRGMFKNNTSGCKGVCLVNGLWKASIGCGNSKFDLGNFVDFEDAVIARKKAEENLWMYINELKEDGSFVDENGGVINA